MLRVFSRKLSYQIWPGGSLKLSTTRSITATTPTTTATTTLTTHSWTWHDSRRSVSEAIPPLSCPGVVGYVVNVTKPKWLGLRASNHWYAIGSVPGGPPLNLDSDLDEPEAFESQGAVYEHLRSSLTGAQDCHVFVVQHQQQPM